jgi:hypothetical protein
MNEAREQREAFNLVLNRFALERLLYRLAVAPHGPRFVLKGPCCFKLGASSCIVRPEICTCLARDQLRWQISMRVFRGQTSIWKIRAVYILVIEYGQESSSGWS